MALSVLNVRIVALLHQALECCSVFPCFTKLPGRSVCSLVCREAWPQISIKPIVFFQYHFSTFVDIVKLWKHQEIARSSGFGIQCRAFCKIEEGFENILVAMKTNLHIETKLLFVKILQDDTP